ncbi:hypothetical protein BDR26DRAFT_867985 [Obelidium mucronatum]|nr:hypothetical protein BDR26DRAFT_867985 [Obelidium mucronatum]
MKLIALISLALTVSAIAIPVVPPHNQRDVSFRDPRRRPIPENPNGEGEHHIGFGKRHGVAFVKRNSGPEEHYPDSEFDLKKRSKVNRVGEFKPPIDDTNSVKIKKRHSGQDHDHEDDIERKRDNEAEKRDQHNDGDGDESRKRDGDGNAFPEDVSA